MDKADLHIICHDVPYPPDYGGVFDLFYKIKALKEQGIRIILHCFEYGRGVQPALENYCTAVHYYQRRTGHKAVSSQLPYIVCSRSNPELLERLLQDEYPILLEGVHCSYLLNDPRFKNRKILLRLHNVESVYYRQLARCTASLFKKIYYLRESIILKKYERAVAAKWPMLAVNESDADYFRAHFHAQHVETIPVFLPYESVSSRDGIGCYCLYHGNLSVEENEKAAVWLLEKVFNDLKIPLVIAGRKPSARLSRITSQYPNACLIADPSPAEMQDIIAKAQLHVLPSFNSTGIKLKLLNALFNGRHCIVNEEAVEGTGLEALCHTARHAGAFKNSVTDLYEKPFTLYNIESRQTTLLAKYDKGKTVAQLIKRIW